MAKADVEVPDDLVRSANVLNEVVLLRPGGIAALKRQHGGEGPDSEVSKTPEPGAAGVFSATTRSRSPLSPTDPDDNPTHPPPTTCFGAPKHTITGQPTGLPPRLKDPTTHFFRGT